MALRILYVSTIFPYPAHRGGKLRISNIIDHLSTRHEVYLASLCSEHKGKIDELCERAGETCTGVRAVPHERYRWKGGLRSLLYRKPYEVGLHQNAEMDQAVERAIIELDPDLIWCSRLASLQYLPDKVRTTVLLDQHDLASRLWKIMGRRTSKLWVQAYARYNRRLVERYQQEVYEDIDICVSVSEEERRLTKQFAPADTDLLAAPNGVDVSYFSPSGKIEEEKGALVSVGSMDQTRNVNASRFFVDEILPRIQDRGLDVTYYIVGQNPTDEVQKMGEQPGVVVTGTVDDVRPFLERSAVVVAPYRMGSGVKHKIPIAFAMGKPVVGTPNACHGIEVTHERNVMIAESPASFADAIHELLNSEEKRKNLGEHAQSFIREEYSWRAITEQLLSSIESLIEKENVPGAR